MAGNFTLANLNAEIRDRHEASRATLTGDNSADADMWLAVKTGTLASRSSVTHKAGRFYRTTDTHELFISDGTNWRHAGGAGAYDDFRRANNTNLNTNNPYQPTGSPWTEEAGDWDISSDLLRLTAATAANATLNTSSLLDRPYSVEVGFSTNTTQAAIDIGVVLKYVDSNNLLYARLIGTAMEIRSVIAGSNSSLSSISFSPSANSAYYMRALVFGKSVNVWLNSAGSFAVFVPARHDNIAHANLAAATKVGFRTPNTAERFAHIAVHF